MSKNNRKPNLLPRPKMTIKANQESDIIPREIPINRVIPQELSLQYADGLVIQQRDGMFILSFFQTKLPLATTLEEAANIKTIDTVCVAQILLTPAQMEQNITAMASSYEKFLKNTSEKDEKAIKT